jgi:hypothetical protein
MALSSGSVVVTTVIAVISLILATASIAWQWYTFSRSGGRVQVEAQFGLFGSQIALKVLGDDDDAKAERKSFRIPPDAILRYGPKSFSTEKPVDPSVRAIATIRNTGRMAVTIEKCIWRSRYGETMGNIHIEPGVALPHRLSEYEQCISVADFGTVAGVLDHETASKREVWPVVILGNGRAVRGNSLQIPAGVTAKLDPDSENLINLTTRRIPDDLLDPAITLTYLRAAIKRTCRRGILTLKHQR